MVPQSTTQISRPLPPSRPILPTPPRGTIYVVERFGRFSRLLPGNGPPLLPLVDRVIAAYARRVDQATPSEGLVAIIPGGSRVVVHAKWSVRVTDPRKLAYRISDVDRCVDMLILVRIRDTLSSVPPATDLDDPSVLKRISDAIRAGVDSTAARFGISCPHFKVLSLRPIEEKPQRSLNLADGSSVPDYYTNGIETVLPELPRDATNPGMHFFSSLPSLPPPKNINYPQPIAYPQPPQQPRRSPALASVRLPPPAPIPMTTNGEVPASDDESLYHLYNNSSEKLPHSQSFRELPSVTSPESEPTEQAETEQRYARSQSLPHLIVSGEESPDLLQPSSDLEAKASRGLHSWEEEGSVVAKAVSKDQADEDPRKAHSVSDDESTRPVLSQETCSNAQELPRDTSYVTDDSAPSDVAYKREVLYAPPPSPTVPNGSASNLSVLPEVLSSALAAGIENSTHAAADMSASFSSEGSSTTPERASPPPEQHSQIQEGVRESPLPKPISAPAERESPPPERELPPPKRESPPPKRELPSPKRESPPPKRVSPPPERESPPPERESPPPEHVSPPEPVSPPPEHISPPPEHISPPPEYMSPPSERVSSHLERLYTPLESAFPRPELVSPPPECASPHPERVLTPPELTSHLSERVSPTPGSPPPEGIFPSPGRASPPLEQTSHLTERSSPVQIRTSSPLVSLPPTSPSDGFSAYLDGLFASAGTTTHAERPLRDPSSEPASDSQEAPTASPVENANAPKTGNMSHGQASEESATSCTNAIDRPILSPLMSTSEFRPADPSEQVVQDARMSQTGKEKGVEQVPQSSQASQPRLAPTSLAVRAGVPLLGPPMIPIPMQTVREHHPVLPATVNSSWGSQTAASGLMMQTRSLASLPPRAPTPPVMPLSAPVLEVASISQRRAGPNRQLSSDVAAEGLVLNRPVPSRPLPLNIGSTHVAEVDSRARRAFSGVRQPLYGREEEYDQVHKDESDYSSAEAALRKEIGFESEDTNTTMIGRPLNSPPLKREPRKRHQHVQTASLFSSVVGKAEKAAKSAGASLSSDQIDGPKRSLQAPSNSPHISGSTSRTGTGGVRMNLPLPGSQPNLGTAREGAPRQQIHGIHHAMAVDPDAFRNKETQRRGPEDVREEAHPRRDGKRLRTTEEEESLSRKEHARREKLMGELDKIPRKRGDTGSQSSDDDSTRMMIDDGSDEERERFNDEVLSQSSSHTRRRRAKTRHGHRRTGREDDAYDSDGTSSEEACTDCGRHHHHEGSSHRRGRSKSRSKRSEGSHHDRSDYDSESRSVSRRRSGRERKGSSEMSVDSHRSGRSSSRDRHRSKKSHSRDRKIEKSSSTRSRSRDGKRSHSKSRSSSSRKRDGEERKRKESKSKSRGRDKREGPTPEQLEYNYKETEFKSIYRHRLPESDSGPENPIPWYCEGQSEPEDTDPDEEVGPDSSDSDDRKRSKKATVYSSYGRRDRYGRRHRAHHNRSVTFLYDDRRRG